MEKNNKLIELEEKLNPLLSGVTGEYYVAAELSKRGHIATLTPKGAEGIDILCSNAVFTKTIAIQVKTNRGSSPQWLMTKKAEGHNSENLFYILVNLNDNQKEPNYYIVPSKDVSKHVTETHAFYISNPAKNGKARMDGSMRKFIDLQGVYLNRWDLLGL